MSIIVSQLCSVKLSIGLCPTPVTDTACEAKMGGFFPCSLASTGRTPRQTSRGSGWLPSLGCPINHSLHRGSLSQHCSTLFLFVSVSKKTALQIHPVACNLQKQTSPVDMMWQVSQNHCPFSFMDELKATRYAVFQDMLVIKAYHTKNPTKIMLKSLCHYYSHCNDCFSAPWGKRCCSWTQTYLRKKVGGFYLR